jgi:hypothetical protein
MPNPRFYSPIIATALLLLCGLAYMVAAGIRTWNLTRCGCCGAAKVRPSVTRSWLDKLVAVLFLKPYRCAVCRTRFYAFRTFSSPDLPASSVAGPAVRVRPARPPLLRPVRVIIRLRLPRRSEIPAWLTETVE